MQLTFSEHENLVLKILGKRRMTIEEISEEFYHSRQLPSESRNYVAGVIRRIERKCDRLKLEWTLHGKGVGRGGRTIWRGKRTSLKKESDNGIGQSDSDRA